MRLLDVLGFAVSALRGHRLRTALSLLGVAIGVAAALALWVAGTMMTYSSFAVHGDDLGNVLLWGGMSLGNIGPFFVWIAWLVSGTNRGEL